MSVTPRGVVPTSNPLSPMATPSPSPTSSAALAAANSALTNTQSIYATLPHTSLTADLTTLAAKMVASGQFKTAALSPGGITATLPNGALALVFADRVTSQTTAASSRRSGAAAGSRTVQAFTPVVTGKTETIALFVNTTDTSGAFSPVNQTVIAAAIASEGFTNDHYGVDVTDAELESFANESASIEDVVDIATHGMVATTGTGSAYYWLSDSPINSAELVKFAPDYAAGNIAYAITLSNGDTTDDPTFAFTPAFLTTHTTLRTGAIVINESCFGQHPLIASQVAATLKAEGVGRYFGWDNPVTGQAADQTDAFIWDRLLGESTTTLGQFVTQRVPAQRPFPLDDVDGILKTETRAGPFGTSTLTYAQSPTYADYPGANLVITDLGGETGATPPVEYFLPSISYVAVTEDPANPSLTIYGKFPPETGRAVVIDPSVTSAVSVAPTTWATDHIVIPIPVTGMGSKGLVIVASDNGVQSNGVPLTQWSGTLTGSESAAWTTMGAGSGSGSGTIGTAYTIDFRADVHPTVPSIDASPVPQNFTFAQVEGDSTAQVTALRGAFATSDGMHSAVLGLNPSAAALVPAMPPLSNGFYVRSVAGQPAACNNSMPGPQSGNTNVFCPGVAFDARAAGTCTDDNGTLCSSATWNALFAFGAVNGVNDGLVTFAMDPASYAIAVSSTNAVLSVSQFESQATVTGSITGMIGAPLGAPNGKQTSSIRQDGQSAKLGI